MTKRPLASAVTPAPTSAAALGIARTTGVPTGSLDSKYVSGTPAATVTKTCSAVSLPADVTTRTTSPSTDSTSPGLTATTTKEAVSTASATDAPNTE